MRITDVNCIRKWHIPSLSYETKTPLYRSGRKKTPLTLSGLKKMSPGWRLRPRAFAPQASVMAAGVRDDVSHEYTCFMRRGEDARLHEGFLRNKNAALPVRAQKDPLDPQRPEKKLGIVSNGLFFERSGLTIERL